MSRAACWRAATTANKCRSRSLHRKDTALDGTAPRLVYGYGAYGISHSRRRSARTRLSLVDRGFVYAIAHVRGGTDKGWRWYRDGKLAQQAEHVPRFHRGDGISRRQRLIAR